MARLRISDNGAQRILTKQVNRHRHRANLRNTKISQRFVARHYHHHPIIQAQQFHGKIEIDDMAAMNPQERRGMQLLLQNGHRQIAKVFLRDSHDICLMPATFETRDIFHIETHNSIPTTDRDAR